MSLLNVFSSYKFSISADKVVLLGCDLKQKFNDSNRNKQSTFFDRKWMGGASLIC